MELAMVFDRIENGYAVLLLSEMGIEITIPANKINETVSKGQVVYLSIDSLRGV